MYLEAFGNKQDVIDHFELNDGELEGCKILLACYMDGGYDGSAFVLIERGDKLFEVNGSHCSCFGLEEQWDEEETSVEALRHRINEGYLGTDSYVGGDTDLFGVKLKRILTRWENKHK